MQRRSYLRRILTKGYFMYCVTRLFYKGLMKGVKTHIITPVYFKKGFKCDMQGCMSSYIVRSIKKI